MEPHSERGDDDTRAHNTLSAEATHVQVFYPFHPLHGSTLRVICRPKTGDGAVTVMRPSGGRLKIPVWMLSSACAEVEILVAVLVKPMDERADDLRVGAERNARAAHVSLHRGVHAAHRERDGELG